jgi:hypothetical protein
MSDYYDQAMITITAQVGGRFLSRTVGGSFLNEEVSGISGDLERIEASVLRSIGEALIAYATSPQAHPLTSVCTQSSASTQSSITEETFERRQKHLLAMDLEVETVLSKKKGIIYKLFGEAPMR